ncbi:2-phosphoglycerate kinase [Hartmannibacter diazotrophicus]|uniref:2-phosphoglycerate kinase n=1 Tax=Hartmannibacter diazotrophicus TaxID=1482074 RepID=A0A2C9D7K5_9HYPH|nr:bifunctional aminoglycoside phosphotransferase/ATP-binding protein [Hartmannibacter diazotrophicus]SON55731.1 2-phosphoglycerate kinase [Hartmannibacter diazotrophicus]
MIVEDQSPVIAFLMSDKAHGAYSPAEKIETHISIIVLAGERVFKVKRAVKLPYADFSTPEKRLDVCRKEVERNGKTAPGLYLGAIRITREPDGTLVFDGTGDLVDAVVEMRRFDQKNLFDRMAAEGRLTPRLIDELGDEIANFHDTAPLGGDGGAANIAGVLDINKAGFATSHVFSDAELADFHARFRKAHARHAALMDQRGQGGRIRVCHGDLHLRNICLLDGKPRLFDCIEFNDQIATVDVLYDLAYLLMDLWHRDLPGLANRLLNRYLDRTGDDDGLPLVGFFMALRAAVRAHVTATQAEEGAGDVPALTAMARDYYDLARTLLQEAPPHVVAIGGLSGSGKSTVAEAVAPFVGSPPGARILESDCIRKAMFDVAAETKLPPEAYEPEVSRKVYETITAGAVGIAAAGTSVVANAVYDRPELRAAIEGAVKAVNIPFAGFWLDASPDLLRERVGARVKGASDADVKVLEGQLTHDLGVMEWTRLDAAEPVGKLAAEIRAANEV